MKKVEPKELPGNVMKMVGEGWMLVTAGNAGKFNTMTASWGGMGVLWNKPVAFVFVRPQRYTYEFMERGGVFTLTFPGDEYRKALTLCGTRSGRDTDKVAETGLTPFETEGGGVAFREGSVVLECRTLYSDFLGKSLFTEDTIPRLIYPEDDYHKMYIAEITGAWVDQ